MAVPPVVIAGLSQIAMNDKVQTFAGNLIKDVYGKIITPPEEPVDDIEDVEELSLQDVIDRVDNLPTREEMIVSFSVLQAEIETQQDRMKKFVAAGAVANILVLGSLIYFLA